MLRESCLSSRAQTSSASGRQTDGTTMAATPGTWARRPHRHRHTSPRAGPRPPAPPRSSHPRGPRMCISLVSGVARGVDVLHGGCGVLMPCRAKKKTEKYCLSGCTVCLWVDPPCPDRRSRPRQRWLDATTTMYGWLLLCGGSHASQCGMGSWFHLSCLGLKAMPTSKVWYVAVGCMLHACQRVCTWLTCARYCPECRPAFAKKRL